MNEIFDAFFNFLGKIEDIIFGWLGSLPPTVQIVFILLLVGGLIVNARHNDRKKRLKKQEEGKAKEMEELSKKQSEEKIQAQHANAHYRVIQIDNEDNRLYLAIDNDGKYTLSKRPFEANRFNTHEDASVAAVSFRAPEAKIRIEKVGTCTKCEDLTVLDPISEWRASMQDVASAKYASEHFKKMDWSLCDACAKKHLVKTNNSIGVKLMWWWFLAIAIGLIGFSLSG